LHRSRPRELSPAAILALPREPFGPLTPTRGTAAPTVARAPRRALALSTPGWALGTRLALRPLHGGAASNQGTPAAPLRARAALRLRQAPLRDAARPEGLGRVGGGGFSSR